MKDLFVLVADQDMLFTMEALLPRLPNVNPLIRNFSFQIVRHPGRDAGCRTQSADFLRPFMDSFKYTMVMLDFEGCGAETIRPIEIEGKIVEELSKRGWEDRSEAIVIEPELEQWMWTDSPHVADALGWGENSKKLKTWLKNSGYQIEGDPKPSPPKEAFELTLRKAKVGRSASIYKKIAASASFKNCEVPSFVKLQDTMLRWFPIQ
jgi:hypothetical protein